MLTERAREEGREPRRGVAWRVVSCRVVSCHRTTRLTSVDDEDGEQCPSPRDSNPQKLTFSYFLELLILLHIFADPTGGTRTHARTLAHSVSPLHALAARRTTTLDDTALRSAQCRQPTPIWRVTTTARGATQQRSKLPLQSTFSAASLSKRLSFITLVSQSFDS